MRSFFLDAAARVLLATILAAAGCAAQAYRNPVVRGMNPDPSVVRVGADYYLTTSSFEYFPSCPVYHSRDLVHWQRVGYALELPEQFEALQDEHPSTYACTLRYHAGTFYALTTDVRGGGNFLVTAKNAAGPWSLPLPIDKGMFDPSLFFDDDGTVYYTRRGPDAQHNIVQAEIDVATGKLKGELRTISNGFRMDGAEGPHLYKIGGWYYLSLAEGGSRFLHMQTIGRARSPWGPFEADPENPWASQHVSWDYPVLTVGHCDLVDSAAGAWWTACLGTRHYNSRHFSIGRETFLFPVTWQNGWPSVSTDDMRSLDVHHATPGGSPVPAEPERDDFSVAKLGMQWNVLGPAGLKAMSLTERPGFLRLHGQATLSFAQTTAFVGRRQTEWNTASTVRMEFAPTADGAKAGLTVFMSPQYHYDLCKVRHDGKSYMQLIKQVSDMHEVTREVVVGDGPLLLRVESSAETYRFSFAPEGGAWVDMGSGDERQIASEIANVWSGMYIAMFALNPQPEHMTSADFDWFEYKIANQSQ